MVLRHGASSSSPRGELTPGRDGRSQLDLDEVLPQHPLVERFGEVAFSLVFASSIMAW